jgi:serine protease
LVKRLLIALSFAGSFLIVPSLGTAGSTLAAGAPNPDHGPPTIYLRVRDAHAARPNHGGSNNLVFHGGNPGVVTGADQVYLVFWGSQWTNNDPSNEASIEQSFFSGVGGSSWNNTVTQYCQGITSGSSNCSGASKQNFATNPSGVYAGSWSDNSAAAPSRPTQTQRAAEAVNAANYVTTHGGFDPLHAQIVINTAHGNNSSGFGTQWCAWHSSTSYNGGSLAYTNMPYITDAGGSCGANFVNSGSAGLTDGITIVGGHEFAETETDIYPNGGWLDGNGAEIGDKCAWISSGSGAAYDLPIGSKQYAVQSLWSNAASGCVQSS